jgi:ATP-dependent DNA helicase RecG
LAVIDEQHRFGVEQRAVLSESAEIHPHVLVMTATPIPRSVAMTVFGDLEVSTLRGQPLGRAGVQTTLVELRRHPAWETRIWERVREEVAGGRQVFVVAPRIDPSDKETPDPDDPDWQPGANVVELAATLSAGALNGLKLGILHGALSASEKSETMAAFTAGGLDVLVATTVIEVGVDVPNATMMVVMDADRFGISQLHQLRGRIGRGEFPGLCLLVTNTRPGTVAADRLAAVAATNDGFELAELDLAQRREGNILGADQSGARSSLRLLRVIEDADLIAEARTLAESLVSNDPTLSDPYLSDMVTQLETQASPEWLDRS